MLIIPEAKVVYVLPPKCGTHTTKAILDKHFPRLHRHAHGVPIHAVQADPEWADYTWVMNVRNPFTRTLSWWNHYRTRPNRKTKDKWYEHVKRLDTFDAAGRDHELCWGDANFWWRATLNYYWAMLPRLDHMVRVEHFCEDFNKLPFIRERDITVDVKPQGVGDYSAVDKWWQHYTSHMFHFVQTLCAGDFSRLSPKYPNHMLGLLPNSEHEDFIEHLETVS